MIKTALIGLGRIGWTYHLPKLIENKGFSLCAVVDVCEDRLNEAKEAYGVSGYIDMAEMLKEEKPELVVIASPTHLHREHAFLAFDAGADVFLDKPMATSYKEACEIAEKSKQTGRKLMIYQPHRTFPEIEAVRQIIREGKLGDIYMIKRGISMYSRRNDWQTLKKFGGGMINNYGAHFIDQMLYITQDTIAGYYCNSRRVASVGDAEDVVKIILEMGKGTTIDLDINCASAHALPMWMVFGQYGTARYEGNGWGEGEFILRYFDPKAVEERVVDESLAAAERKYSNDIPLPWVDERMKLNPEDRIEFYDKCYEFYAEDKAPFVPLEHTLMVMKVTDEMRNA